MIIGVDYGSKLAGTTVIAYNMGDGIRLDRSKKNQDADQMIIDFVAEYNPQVIGIDAPLSLPGVYTGLVGFEDYHYRACDKALKAMSPMFLGGLTARAMKLRSSIEKGGAKVLEVYPVMTGKALGLTAFGYRKKDVDYGAILAKMQVEGYEMVSDGSVNTSHDLDAILALHALDRVGSANEKRIGSPEEGVIYY